MDSEWIIRLVLFGIVHWVLAAVMLQDLANRDRVFGKRKQPWAIMIIFIPCFGSLLYLLFHPQIFHPPPSRPDRRDDKHKK